MLMGNLIKRKCKMFEFLKGKSTEQADHEKQELKVVVKSLEKDKRQLKEELAELKLKKKLEEEDIKHMVKINNERKDIELEKAKMELERESATAIAKVKDSYQNKTEQQLEKQLINMKDMYGEILERLPNYNVSHKINERG